MKLSVLYLITVSFWYSNGQQLVFDWKNTLPWKEEMPKEDYKRNVALRLIKKDWMPKGSNLPNGNDITPRYSGSVEEAFKMFIDKTNMYEYYERPLEKAVELLTEENGYRAELDSIIVIHTISGDANNYFVRNMMIVLAVRNFIKQFNVFAINMPGLQPSMEQTIIRSIFGMKANYGVLGETIGDFFNSAIKQQLMTPEKIHLFGFCYSSQLSGYIARYISSKNDKQKIKSITALDPYSIGLGGIRNRVLSKNDAQLVFAYHTNSMALGSLYRKATADFNFNSGLSQPGCYKSKSIMCSHRRAVTAFWYVILYPDMWLARKCPDWLLFKSCLCNWNAKVFLSFPPSPGAKGMYFFNTTSHKPYAYGSAGANCFTRFDEKMKTGIQNDSTQKEVVIDFAKAKGF